MGEDEQSHVVVAPVSGVGSDGRDVAVLKVALPQLIVQTVFQFCQHT